MLAAWWFQYPLEFCPCEILEGHILNDPWSHWSHITSLKLFWHGFYIPSSMNDRWTGHWGGEGAYHMPLYGPGSPSRSGFGPSTGHRSNILSVNSEVKIWFFFPLRFFENSVECCFRCCWFWACKLVGAVQRIQIKVGPMGQPAAWQVTWSRPNHTPRQVTFHSSIHECLK